MHIRTTLLAFVIGVIWVSGVLAQGTLSADAIHQQILTLYNCHPHDLNKQQVADKSVALDGFWANAKADPTSYLPVLRRDLKDPNSPSFFMYDGSKLLLSLTNTPEDR